MKPKKIAIIYQGARFYGGIEKYLEELFANIDKEKFELILISLGDWTLTQKLKDKEKVILLSFSWYRYDFLYKLRNLLGENNFDLVVSQGMVANFYARISSKMANKPNLVVVHSNYDYDFQGIKKILYLITFKTLDAMTKKYIVVSKYLREKVVELGISPGKIKVVYNGVADGVFHKNKSHKEIVLGTFGRLHFTKNYHNLIHAITYLKDEKFKLYIWGEGEEKNHLAELIKHHKVKDKVVLKGFADDVKEEMRNIDVYIQPSLAEGFGLTVVEAMLAEKPVIVTPAGSLPELVTDGKTGLVTRGFSPEAIAATIKIALTDKKILNNMGKTAREEAIKRFSVEKWIDETSKVFLEAME